MTLIHQSFNKLILVLSWGLACSLAQAVTVAQEQDKLARFEQAYENHLVEIEDIENEIFGYEYKLKDARQDEQEAEQDLLEAKRELAAAQQTVKEEASQDNQRALTIAAHAHKMAVRGVRTRHKRLQRIEGNLAELQAQLQKEKTAAEAVKRRIVDQEKRVAQAIAILERQANEALVEKAPVTPPAAVSKAPELQPELKAEPPAALESQVASAPAPEPQAVAAADEVNRELDEISELDREALAYARREMARLEALIDEDDTGKPLFKRLVLRGSSEGAVMFEFLGRNQYRAEGSVSKGKQLFEVGNRKFRRTIPESDDGETYVFIFDARRLSRPRLVMFKKSLLELM